MDAATSISNERGKRHDALNGVALLVRNSQLDKSASVRGAELLTVMVSRTSRRNVLGAIALKRSIATSRGDDNRDECKTSNYSTAHEIEFETANHLERYRCATTAMETVLA